MIVSPFGRIHFCAVLGGNVIAAERSSGAAFKLTMGGRNKAMASNRASLATYLKFSFNRKWFINSLSATDQHMSDDMWIWMFEFETLISAFICANLSGSVTGEISPTRFRAQLCDPGMTPSTCSTSWVWAPAIV